MNESSWQKLAQRMAQKQLRARGIRDERVLDAMASVPRHCFIPKESGLAWWMAYEDRALAIGEGQTISQPFIVGWMTSMLKVEAGQKVLEIGTGSGYQAAVLAAMGAQVVSVERIEKLARRATAAIEKVGLAERVKVVIGDGTMGYEADGLYDRVIVTAGAPALPSELERQLQPGGRMVLPIGDRKQQRLIAYEKRDGELIEAESLACRFVPLIGEAGWEVEGSD